MKGLVRIRHRNGRGGSGWQARRYVRPRQTRYFSDWRYGGSRNAKKAAADWLRVQYAVNGEHNTPRRVLRTPRTNGEPPGVYRAWCFGRRGFMCAWTDKDGQLHRKWFGVDKYGANALAQAVAWRREAEKQVHGALMPATRYALDRKRLIRERG